MLEGVASVRIAGNETHAAAGDAIVVPADADSSWPTPGPGRCGCCAVCLSAARPVSPTAAPSPLRGRSSAHGGNPPLARLFAVGYRQLIDGLHDRLRDRGWTDVRPAFGFVLLAARDQPTSVTELAELMGMTKQAASKLVDAMVSSGYIQRGTDPRRAAAAGNPYRPRRRTAVRSRADIRRARGWLGQVDRHLAPRSHAPGPHAYPFRPRERSAAASTTHLVAASQAEAAAASLRRASSAVRVGSSRAGSVYSMLRA